MVVQVIPQTDCRTVPPPHHHTAGRFSIDGFRGTRVHVGVTEIGPVLAEPPRELSLETGRMEYPGESGIGPEVPHAASIRENALRKINHDDSSSAGTFKDFSGVGRHGPRKGVSRSWRGHLQIESGACPQVGARTKKSELSQYINVM